MKHLFYLLLIPLLFTACVTGKKAFERGDYYTATVQSVQRLRKDPTSEDALQTIRKSYPMAIDYYTQKAEQTYALDEHNKFMIIRDCYIKLNTLADEIQRCPAALKQVDNIVIFDKQLAKANDLAIDEQMNIGRKLLARNSMEDARLATEHYQLALDIDPMNTTVQRELEIAYAQATLNVIIEPIPVQSTYYKFSSIQFFDNTIERIKSKNTNKFVAFYSTDEANKANITVHHLLRMNFDPYSMGNIAAKEIIEEVHSDSVLIDENRNIYGIVSAKTTTHIYDIISHGILNLEVYDLTTQEIIKRESFSSEYIWTDSWLTYNGDNRALTYEQQILANKEPVRAPDPQELFYFFSKPVAENVSSYLKTFYKKM